MSSQITKEQQMKVRLTRRTEREFVIEANALDDPQAPRKDVRDAVYNLTTMEQQALKSRIRRRLEVLNELFHSERKTYDEPHIQHEDLQPGVRIPGYHE